MDRNEAIEHLKVVLKTCDVQDEEAVEMAIEALEGKDTNVSTKEDVISVGWIEKKRDGLVSDYKYIIDWLILEWKKEQGEIHNK